MEIRLYLAFIIFVIYPNKPPRTLTIRTIDLNKGGRQMVVGEGKINQDKKEPPITAPVLKDIIGVLIF